MPQKKCLKCEKKAVFNHIGEKNGIYCKTHKEPEMVDVVNKKCLECDKIPLYNFKGIKRGIYCNTHKKDNMVNVIHRICKTDLCTTQASYNVSGKYAEYCTDHRTKEMERVIYTKFCEFKDCPIRAAYNYIGKKTRRFCAKHKKDNMICLNTKCIQDGCIVSANYNYDGKNMALYCATHKTEGMVDVKSKRCKTPMCFTLIDKHGKNKYE